MKMKFFKRHWLRILIYTVILIFFVIVDSQITKTSIRLIDSLATIVYTVVVTWDILDDYYTEKEIEKHKNI